MIPALCEEENEETQKEQSAYYYEKWKVVTDLIDALKWHDYTHMISPRTIILYGKTSASTTTIWHREDSEEAVRLLSTLEGVVYSSDTKTRYAIKMRKTTQEAEGKLLLWLNS